MKKLFKAPRIVLLGLLSFVGQQSEAVTLNFSVDTTKSWVGIMEVFNNNSGAKGSWQYWQGYDLTLLKSTVGTNVITLQPNFNRYASNPNNAYWRNNGGTGPLGNKWLELTTYVDYGVLSGPNQDLIFSGVVDSYTLASGYKAFAFIQGFNSPLSTAQALTPVISGLLDLSTYTSGSTFNVSVNSGSNAALTWRYGFMLQGINANPTDEVTLGSAVVSSVPEPSALLLLAVGLGGLAILRRRRS